MFPEVLIDEYIPFTENRLKTNPVLKLGTALKPDLWFPTQSLPGQLYLLLFSETVK